MFKINVLEREDKIKYVKVCVCINVCLNNKTTIKILLYWWVTKTRIWLFIVTQ